MREINDVVNTPISAQADVEISASEGTSRRALLGRAIAAGAGLAALRLMPSAQAATTPKQPEAETGKDYPQPKPNPQTEAQYRKALMGVAMLSLATSQIAVDKATSAEAKKFANFELREAIGVSTVLRDLKTPVPPMSARDRATLAKIKSTPPSAAFDKAYMTAQLGAHEFLRDLAENYISNSAGRKSMAEMHTRHLAIVSLATFKEHVVHCKDFLKA